MTDFKASDRDVNRVIRSWLHEDRHEDASRVAAAVLDQLDTIPQRRSRWLPARRTPIMSKFISVGLGAAALVVALFVGSNLLGYASPPPGGAPPESAAPSEAEPSVEPSAAADLPIGPHVMVSTVGLNEDRVTVTIPAPGWFAEPDDGSLTKDLGGDDRVTVVTVPGDHYQVPANICNWHAGSGLPDPSTEPLGPVNELVAYLTLQTYDADGSLTRDLSAPVDIIIDGHPGQSVTGAVPDIDPNGCDEQRFCSLTDRDGYQCLLPHLEPNALVTFWISAPPDRNPALWVVAASYWPATGSELRAEMNAIVDSMTWPPDPDLNR